NVTVKVSFKGQVSLPVPQASPPTFLFLPYSIVKKQTHIRVKTSKPKPESLNPQEPNLAANPQVFQERRTSSLAAPPPSSVSGLIEDTPETSQQQVGEKIQKNSKSLVLMRYFRFSETCMLLRLECPAFIQLLVKVSGF
ncbi:hypothetical protein RHIZ_23355, partial [Rhizobium skierniewicense]|uniref:hypothetical protein n=1 Tax=Rhizobium skierniewicense TaxID=984260 RepID=UPI001FAE2EE3